MKKIALFFLMVLYAADSGSQPVPVKLKHKIIIDTDCAIDDMRTISLFLSRPEITIETILVSDGTLLPSEGIVKVRSLLQEFGKNTIPIACGTELSGVNPPWCEFNRQINWGSENNNMENDLNAVDCLSEILENADERIVLVCLGPLTNLARLITKDKTHLPKIERVIWYNESVNPLHGFNYECDKASADLVFESGLRIDIISNLHNEQAKFDTSMTAVAKESDTRLAEVISHVFSQAQVIEKLNQDHFRLCDDLTAIYLTNPELFDMNTLPHKIEIRYNREFDIRGVREAFCDMIKGTYVSDRNVVFNRFPDKREFYNYDVRPIMDSAIARYGHEEWKANVMTDEFHGHLGVFSIVGAKMGIKARELFDVGPDMLTVISYAGSKPPYSCMNDGIQVSTGATLGMGTIQLASDSIPLPTAVFTYRNRVIRISLKKEYLQKVDADINEGIVKYGLTDDGYWKLIRRNALKYWLDWNRDEIFDITTEE